MAGRGIDGTGVATAIAGTTTAIAVDGRVIAHIELVSGEVTNQWLKMHLHDHCIASSIGQIIGNDAILTALSSCRHRTVKPG